MGSQRYSSTRPRPTPLAGYAASESGALQGGGQAALHGDALAGPAGLRDGRKRDTPTTSRGLPHARPRAELNEARCRLRRGAAPGPARGRAAPLSTGCHASCGAVLAEPANPERTTCHRPSHRETRKHEDTAHPVHGGTACQPPAARVRVREEEVIPRPAYGTLSVGCAIDKAMSSPQAAFTRHSDQSEVSQSMAPLQAKGIAQGAA